METKLSLNEETCEALSDLIACNLDSARDLRAAADSIDDKSMASLFSRVAVDRENHANELRGYLRANDVDLEDDDGSVKEAVRRKWIELRAAINSGDRKVVLIEAERAEDVIKGKYERTLTGHPGTAVSDVLHRQFREVKRHHDLIRDLRDAA